MRRDRGDVADVVDTLTEQKGGRIVSKTHAIRTTINPGEVIKVDDAELVDLTRQGLVKSVESDDKPADTKGKAS